ncbi:hypothetical protein EC991_003946 [Linnemannia zychae]|nr:hypothetical protein EC991_003946 [Linnemannia zychae]
MAEQPNTNNSATNTNANFGVGGVGVSGAQVELMETMQPQSYQNLQQQQHDSDYAHQVQQHALQQQQQPFYQQEPVVQDQRQFDQQYQQSFYSQPSEGIQANSASVDADMAAPAVTPANTNAIGDGSPGFSVGGVGVPGAQVELIDSMGPQALYQNQQPLQQSQYIQQQTTAPAQYTGEDATNFHVGGLGAPGAQVECLPTIEEQQTTTTSAIDAGTKPLELETVQQASAARPPVGPFDPPAESDTTATNATAAPPTIFLQREASMRHGQDATIAATTATTTSTTTSTPQVPHKVHVASSGAVAAAAAAQAADASTRGRRRSSLAVLADKIRSSTSRSRSPSLSRRLSRTISRHSLEDGEDDSVGGPYRDVKIAQQEHVAKLRAEQEKNGITHNIDGIPIPPVPERQRRRSSVGHILGLDKPLLSR